LLSLFLDSLPLTLPSPPETVERDE